MSTSRYRVRCSDDRYRQLYLELEKRIDILQEGILGCYLFEQVALSCKYELRKFKELTITRQDNCILIIHKKPVITITWTTKS